MAALSLSVVLPAALLWAVQVGATIFPATVEVDLIFPRNDTYAPSPLFPIVFAFQNAALAASLGPAFDLQVWNNSAVNDLVGEGPILDLTWTNFSSSEPLYVYTYLHSLGTTYGLPETTHTLSWGFGARNCSNVTHSTVVGGGWRSNSVDFTIRSGAQQPDLVAATTNSSLCTNASHFAFNLTGTMGITPTKPGGSDRCAVFSDAQPLVSGNPCAVQVSSATASSIMAAVTAANCAAAHPTVSCPASKAAAPRGWKTGYTALLGGFVAASMAAAIQSL